LAEGKHMAQKPQRRSEDVRKFKGTTVIDWDSEPTQERPSEFAESSLFLSQSAISRPSKVGGRSGQVHHLERARPRPAQKRGGSAAALWMGLLLVVVVAGGGLYGLMHFLRG
jgi:hypothetical protein